MKKLFSFVLCLAFALSASAQELRDCVSLRLNSDNGVYAIGEKIQVWADVKDLPAESPVLDVSLYGDVARTESKTVSLKRGENLLFEGSFDKATHYVYTLRIGENNVETTMNVLKIGFVVSPEDFALGFEEPSDVRKYWRREFRKMRKDKMHPVITKQSVSDGKDSYELELNCVGPAPVRAYVAHPSGAAKKSLPIILYLHAAGRPGSPASAGTARSYASYGALAMDLNAHGMLNDQPKEYYDTLSTGLLNGYSSREPSDRDDYYFKWMFLRAERALEYLMADPLWDGKHILVTGTSQGGGQSAFLAAINPKVTAALLIVPAMLDQGGALQGRICSWPKTYNNYPESSSANSPYFDPGLILKHTKADVFCEIGLFDLTCPAPNLFATLNTVKTAKVIKTWQRQHHDNRYNAKEHETLVKARADFIREQITK